MRKPTSEPHDGDPITDTELTPDEEKAFAALLAGIKLEMTGAEFAKVILDGCEEPILQRRRELTSAIKEGVDADKHLELEKELADLDAELKKLRGLRAKAKAANRRRGCVEPE